MDNLPFELQALSKASRYQKWIRDLVMPHMGERILELGSGIGNMSQWLPIRDKLVLTEVNADLRDVLRERMSGKKVSIYSLDVENEDMASLEPYAFDTVVSFNVIEHIEKDKDVFQKLFKHLKHSPGHGPKRIVTFVPAHNWAFGKMDAKFGHFRRYDKQMMDALAKETGEGIRVKSRYMNTPGLLGWYLTGKILGREEIGDASIKTFEMLCPIIRPLDNFIHTVFKLPMGQSLISVWEIE